MFLEQFPNQSQTNGWLEVICGSMFSGKTEELIRRVKRAEFAQLPVLLLKPNIDNRFSDSKITSHEGATMEAMEIANSAEIMSVWSGQVIVAIDEGQFFDNNLPEVCSELAEKGVRIIVAGLDMDFRGQPFGPIPNLLASADYVTKLHAICAKCSHLAQFSHRTTKRNELVLIGAKENYEPLCRSCFCLEMKTL